MPSSQSKDNNEFDILDIKMEQSLDRLTYIKNILTTKKKQWPLLENERLMTLQNECLALKTQLREATQEQEKNEALLESRRIEMKEIQQKLDTLQDQYNRDQQSWQDKLNYSQERLEKINRDYLELQQVTEAKWSRLKEAHNRDIQRKEQLELLLKENTEELRLITETAMERDHKLDQYEQSAIKAQQMMDEKDELLERYVTEAQQASEELAQLHDRINQLELDNIHLKDQLEEKNTPIETKSNLEKPSFPKIDPSNTTRNSRIPVATHQTTTPSQQEYITEIQKLKKDLSVRDQKLMEKTTLYKELESALERRNDHCEILSTRLNEATEESNIRYRKILDLMEENRILKESLNTGYINKQ